MATRKKAATITKPRASMSNERRLALALRAVLDQNVHDSAGDGTAEEDAQILLNNLGYGNLIGLPKLKRELEANLRSAFDVGDYATVTKLSAQLERVKSGKSPKPEPVVKVKTTRKTGQAPSNAEIETAVNSTLGASTAVKGEDA